MAIFKFTREWSGYSRGTDYIEVEAETAQEALDEIECSWASGEREVVRDDTEAEAWECII